ncbi:MAG: hydrogen peroxide-inducible genes activator [Pseudomonadota bacterium]
MVSIKQLKYFNAVVKFGHFGRAAEHCAVTQPALSMQIQNMEADLGVQLLERGPTGVITTAMGREIAKKARRILEDVQTLTEYARHGDKLLTGKLNLGVIPSIAPYILPPLLPNLKTSFPELDLHIRESQTRNLISELMAGQLDLLLLALPIEQDLEDISTEILFKDDFVLALPKGQKLSGRVIASPQMMEGKNLLLLEEGHCMRDQTIAYCQLQQAGNINTQGASSLSTLVQMVANGMGVTLLPEMSMDVEARHQNIELLKFDKPVPSRKIGLAWRKTSARGADFIEFGKRLVASRNLAHDKAGSITQP